MREVVKTWHDGAWRKAGELPGGGDTTLIFKGPVGVI